MKPLVLDKITSVTSNCRLSREVTIGTTFPCKEGDVIAVRILTGKSTYNQVELETGRFSQLKPGDIVAGALGHRKALRGYAGHMPTSLKPGDILNILNLGGVLGICDSVNPDVGPPFECEVLGQILHFPFLGERRNLPANIAQDAPPLDEGLTCDVPVVAVVGTSMSAGKTFACTSLIQSMTHRGMNVAAAKATGVSLKRDVLCMEDAGARATSIFTDLGVVTTTALNAPALTRTMLNHLSEKKPDVIVLELGDGLLGAYGVDAILADEGIRASFSVVMLAANDPVAAWGGHRRLKEEYGIETTLITGPATDNAAGTDLINALLGVPGCNARTAPEHLAETVIDGLSEATTTPAGESDTLKSVS